MDKIKSELEVTKQQYEDAVIQLEAIQKELIYEKETRDAILFQLENKYQEHISMVTKKNTKKRLYIKL